METKTQGLVHTKWLCKYRIVFFSKYGRKFIFAQLRESMKEVLQYLRKSKGVNVLEEYLMSDHVHADTYPSQISVSSFIGYPKGKSLLMLFNSYANLKYKFDNRKF